MRLVVIGPLGLEAGSVNAEEANDLLDLAVPGLGQRLQLDLPRVRQWPTQLSHQGFVAAFRRNTQLPESDTRLRRWILVMGKVLRNGGPIAVGLALQSSEPNTLGPVVLNYPHQWMEVLRFAGHSWTTPSLRSAGTTQGPRSASCTCLTSRASSSPWRRRCALRSRRRRRTPPCRCGPGSFRSCSDSPCCS